MKFILFLFIHVLFQNNNKRFQLARRIFTASKISHGNQNILKTTGGSYAQPEMDNNADIFTKQVIFALRM